MLKPIFDSSDQCGQPNPLLTLSKNFGHANSQIASGIQQPVPTNETAGTSLAQEYLASIAQRTTAPSTFDMRQLLAKLPEAQQSVGDKNAPQAMMQMEQSWTEAQQRSLASNWSDQFLGTNNGQMGQSWVDEFGRRQQQKKNNVAENGKMALEKAWQSAQSASTWAKDFLERYDSSSSSSLSGTHQNQMVREWEQEFLKHMAEWTHHNNNNQSAQQVLLDQPQDFYDYESAWEAVHSKEAQQRYDFSRENPFLEEAYPEQRALEAFGQGRVADSILHYEAALQQEPENPGLWYSLGRALAENEEDPRAISAHRNALKLSPRHKDALLALSVSLTNESFDHLALHELHKWICVHEGDNSAMPEDTAENTTLYRQYATMDRTEFAKVEQRFLSSARQSQDWELQNALSILYNLGRDYDRAVDGIRAALASRPEDPVLWNRLGATLANADRSPEAINAYKRALQLFPAHVRARYNLGIACMNLNSYRDAAEHFVTALQVQSSPDHSPIWSKLRSSLIRLDGAATMPAECFEALERRDLATIVHFLQQQNNAI